MSIHLRGAQQITAPDEAQAVYLWESWSRGDGVDVLSGAHGALERLDDAREAAREGRPCPVSPDPTEQAREWGIADPVASARAEQIAAPACPSCGGHTVEVRGRRACASMSCGADRPTGHVRLAWLALLGSAALLLAASVAVADPAPMPDAGAPPAVHYPGRAFPPAGDPPSPSTGDKPG